MMAPPKRSTSQKKAADPSSPSFDEDALSRLTSKIDKALAEPESAPRAGKRKRQEDDEKPASAAKKRQPKRGGEGKDTAVPKKESDGKDKPVLKKGGEGKDKTKPKKGGEGKAITAPKKGAEGRDKAVPKKGGDGKDKAALLLEEIKALGGDEGDLELVTGVDSDSEEEVEGQEEQGLGASFKNELAKFASRLGFEKAREPDAESEADEDLEESELEGSELEAEDGVEVEAEDEPAAPLPKQIAAKALPVASEPPEKPKDPRWAGKVIFEPRPDWHAVSQAGLPAPSSDDVGRFNAAISSLKAYAQTLLDEDSVAYNAIEAKSSNHRFMSTIMSSGTLSDKVSALTLAAQTSPVHNVKAIDNLLTMAGKKSRGQALAALGALVDLLGNGVVLPSDRRLRPFHAQPGLLGSLEQSSVVSWTAGQKLPGRITKEHLIAWLFEDWLKATYFKILQLLEVWSSDEIEYSRSKSLDFVFGLLRDKPEQEANLMRLLVSKLGDREGKIASRASYLLLQLVNSHPGMKPIVIHTVEQEVVLRPGSTTRTKYHAINTLNQIILSSKEPSVADNLVRIYFELFLLLLKTGALGIFDHLGESDLNGSEPKTQNRKERRQAPDVSGNDQDVAQKLVTAVLTGVNRAIPFALGDETTVEKQIDTLFRITHSSNFNTSIQALILIQQLASSKHLAVDRFYRTLYESLLDPRLITSSKQTLYLNLLYKALKTDADVRRVKAFVKRMLQVVTLHQPPFACAILYLIAELQNIFPDLSALLNDPEDNDDDGEEVYKDVVPDGEVAEPSPAEAEKQQRSATAYDGRKRNPEFSNAHRSCLWELTPYFTHYHPSVSVFAQNLLVRQKSLPKPELANHSLIHFLDKFVYRNPKTTDANRGSSIMQPGSSSASAQTVVGGKTSSKQQPTLNSSSFWNLKSQDVAAEDTFFHAYFSQVGKAGQEASRAAKRREQKKDADDAGSDQDEDEIWQALVDSRPDIEGDADADADMGFSDDDGDDENLAALLDDMSDSGDEDGMSGAGSDAEMEDLGSDGGVEFNDFSDSEAEHVEAGDAKKQDAKKTSRQRRKELKALPTFASAEDYAEMLAQDQDEFDF